MRNNNLARGIRPSCMLEAMQWWQAEYVETPTEWVRDQVREYEESGGTRGTTLRETGLPVIILWSLGAASGVVRKTPLMRVEHEGVYALVGSQGGAPKDPAWVANLQASPSATRIQDGPDLWDTEVREIVGSEREIWWQRCVEAFTPYATYQEKTQRLIPVYLTAPRG